MAFRRIYNQYITTQANATQQVFALNTPDNNQQQRLKSIFVGVDTAAVEFGIQVAGDQLVTVDGTRFTPGLDPLMVDAVANQGVPFNATVRDLGGSAHTNVPFMIEYEVDQG